MDEGKQDENRKDLQTRIDNIARWASDWKMEINPDKSEVMHLGKNNPSLTYFVNGTETVGD